ncbi:MAG: hypothetical protein IJA97_02555 [Clostridia bacterium]|nr:hypothetical protein [Clostridia bacterium]
MSVCCIIGHREIALTQNLKDKVYSVIYDLIKSGVEVFLFGSKSEFNELCYEIVTNLKGEFPNVKRIFVRAEYPIIDDLYYGYLKGFYEESYYYDKDFNSGKLSYIKLNEHLIDCSDCCLFYYDYSYKPKTNTKSGTRLAYDYAVKKRKRIINVYNE